MNKLVNLQMKHDVVVTHQWLGAEQFTDIYSLEQLSPGPNMNMVTVIGSHVSGIPGRSWCFSLFICRRARWYSR